MELDSHNLILARERFEGALQLQPMNFEARYNLGLVALAQNDYELSEERFELLKEQLMMPSSGHVFCQLQERRISSKQEQRNN